MPPDSTNAQSNKDKGKGKGKAMPTQPRAAGEDRLHASMYAWKHEEEREQATKDAKKDEYEIYCSAEEPRMSDVDPVDKDGKPIDYYGDAIRYWKNNGYRFPNLARLAFDALSIPAVSAECERTFSSTKKTLTQERAVLGQSQLKLVSARVNGSAVDTPDGGSEVRWHEMRPHDRIPIQPPPFLDGHI